MSTIILELNEKDMVIYPIPEFDSKKVIVILIEVLQFIQYHLTPILQWKLSSDYSFNLQVCDSGIVRIQINNEYVSFGSGAYLMIPYVNNSRYCWS